MAKANLEGVPETGSKWVLETGATVYVNAVNRKGRGYTVVWEGENIGGAVALREFRKVAKAA